MRGPTKEAIAGFGPNTQASTIICCGFAKLLAPALIITQRVLSRFERTHPLSHWGIVLADHFDCCRRDCDSHEYDRTQPGQRLPLHPPYPQLLNIFALPAR